MISPNLPINEKERQEAVNKYKNLDGLSNETYDNITSLVASICDVPVSLISIIDKNRNYLNLITEPIIMKIHVIYLFVVMQLTILNL